MNTFLFAAGTLTIVVGVIHSILGEILIFSRMREGSVVPKIGKPLLRERHVRILWASWHLISIFGFGFAAILIYASNAASEQDIFPFAREAIAYAMLTGSLLVGFATKGMHPGWFGLLAVATCIWLS